MSRIKSLEETSPGVWRAKYRGNYGLYTIEIATDGKKTKSFSCTCPSDRYPCKHIGMVEEAVAERIKEAGQREGDSKIRAADLLRDLPHEELYNFIVRQAENNAALNEAIMLAFSGRVSSRIDNAYSRILRGVFAKIDLEDEELYDYDGNVYLEPLDRWIDKIEEHIKQDNYGEALNICKACIEEFSAWLNDAGNDEVYCAVDYEAKLIELLEEAAVKPGSDIGVQELYDYCVSETGKDKYKGTEMFDEFNNLLMRLSARINPEEFLVLQDKLFEEIENKSSYAAEKILRRKLNVYRENRQEKKAWELIRNNLQIKSFRKDLVEKYIKEKKYGEAKKLIADVKEAAEKDHGDRRLTDDTWDNFLLDIARKEGDRPNIRKTAYRFIEEGFRKEYYRIYKSSFSAAEWPEAAGSLVKHYRKDDQYFSSSAAELMAEEEDAEALMLYLEKYPSVSRLAEYYRVLAGKYPRRVLALFRATIDAYADRHTGRSSYDDIIRWLKTMMKIKGGGVLAADMIGQYRIRYKNRPAMQEMLKKAFST
jgi:hypothetical protein